MTLKPTQMVIRVAKADRPMRSPRTLGSIDFLMTVMAIKRMMSPIPKKKLRLIKEMTAQGMSTVPVPRMGRMSTIIMTRDMRAAYFTPRMVSPIKLTIKVMVLKIIWAFRNPKVAFRKSPSPRPLCAGKIL